MKINKGMIGGILWKNRWCVCVGGVFSYELLKGWG